MYDYRKIIKAKGLEGWSPFFQSVCRWSTLKSFSSLRDHFSTLLLMAASILCFSWQYYQLHETFHKSLFVRVSLRNGFAGTIDRSLNLEWYLIFPTKFIYFPEKSISFPKKFIISLENQFPSQRNSFISRRNLFFCQWNSFTSLCNPFFPM